MNFFLILAGSSWRTKNWTFAVMHYFTWTLELVSNVLWVIVDQNKNLGFSLRKYLSRRYPAEMLADADFADDLPLLSDKIGNADKLSKLWSCFSWFIHEYHQNQNHCSKYWGNSHISVWLPSRTGERFQLSRQQNYLFGKWPSSEIW